MAEIIPLGWGRVFKDRLLEASSYEEFEALEKDVEEYLEKNPSDFEAVEVLAFTKLRLGKHKEAVKLLKETNSTPSF